MSDNPFILTAVMDAVAQSFFNNMREKYFPRERNYLDAHITMFHALPRSEQPAIDETLSAVTAKQALLQATASDIRFMGFGSVYVIDCPALVDIRRNLADGWQDWLSPQDAQKYQPHITFQNKVDADTAKAVYNQEREKFTPFQFNLIGLDLWTYEGGPWAHVVRYPFIEKG